MRKVKKDITEYHDFKKYSVAEIADMLGLGKTKTRELLDSKLLPATKIGRDYFTSPQYIKEFLIKNIGNELHFQK